MEDPSFGDPSSEPLYLGREHRSEPATELGGRLRIGALILATVYMGLIALIAKETGAFYVLLPALGALSYEVTGHPHGQWAGAPIALAVSPPLAGLIGIAICNLLPYGLPSVLLTVAGALAVLLALRSPIAPAISAGLLPLVLGVKSWWYPPAIALGCVMLAAVSVPWKRFSLRGEPGDPPAAAAGTARAADSPWPPYWLAALLGFVTAAVALVNLTGMRFLLFPPLVVIAYEMLRKPLSCPWASRPLLIPLVCFLTAAGGLLLYDLLGVGVLAAMLCMAWSIVVLRTVKVHMPPAMAVALLPMVMTAPTLRYPFAVGLGTLLLTLWFLAYRWAVVGSAA